MSLRSKTATMFVLLAGLLVVGCSSETRVPVFPAGGTLKVDGQPFGNVVLNLTSTSGEQPGAHASVKPDGTFTLSTYEEGDGAANGTFNVELLVDAMAAEFTDVPQIKPCTVTISGSEGSTSTVEVNVEKSKVKPGVIIQEGLPEAAPGMGPGGT